MAKLARLARSSGFRKRTAQLLDLATVLLLHPPPATPAALEPGGRPRHRLPHLPASSSVVRRRPPPPPSSPAVGPATVSLVRRRVFLRRPPPAGPVVLRHPLPSSSFVRRRPSRRPRANEGNTNPFRSQFTTLKEHYAVSGERNINGMLS
uniref:Uncharacterized protein n=1 Tax=Setaria viridis TaxID=4556 RepID=A0A4U6VUT4_SETVI|nr:hypothetical protein SEVIR_3G341781v2 [Setaria viridis]